MWCVMAVYNLQSLVVFSLLNYCSAVFFDCLSNYSKELIAAVTTAELSKKVFVALGLSDCKQYFLSDSDNVLQWIKNKDLLLDRFIIFRAALKNFVYFLNRRIGDIFLRIQIR